MRIIFLSNFYPPASRGGYEQWCQEVAEGLCARGHEIVVLTSRHGGDQIGEGDPGWVHRELYLEMEIASLRNGIRFFTNRKGRERENLICLRQQVETFKPDFILVWGMWNLPRSLPALAEQLMPGRVVYYMGDYWPTLPAQFVNYWQAPARNGLARLLKKYMGAIALRILERETQPELFFEHILFPTQFMHDELVRKGIVPKNSKVIYGAVDTSLYNTPDGLPKIQPGEAITLLYIGRLTAEKGVHTAIEALGKLVNHYGKKTLKFSIVGSGDPTYETRLHEMMVSEGVEPYVHFSSAQPKEAMPGLYQQADIFLFTSIWPEPFGRVLVEAMASGLPVVGTATGGAAEILVDGENALLFPAGDSTSLAEQILKLVESPSERQRLGKNGQQRARDVFDSHRMVGEIEVYLGMLPVR